MTVLLIGLSALALYMCGLFGVSVLLKNNGVADVGYGIAFMVLIATVLAQVDALALTMLLASLPFIWGTRLAVRIYRKNRGKPEDFRYRAWRESWGSYVLVRGFFQIYMLQGSIAFLIALPVTLTLVFPASSIVLPLVYGGIFLWFVGFFFEVVGDAQLDRFLRAPENKGRIMTRGLWHYSRHPNYFGESLMWWGLAIAASGLCAVPLIGFISPLLITFLLLKVSGVPMLEKRWEGNPAWEAYKAKTSVFIPLPPRR